MKPTLGAGDLERIIDFLAVSVALTSLVMLKNVRETRWEITHKIFTTIKDVLPVNSVSKALIGLACIPLLWVTIPTSIRKRGVALWRLLQLLITVRLHGWKMKNFDGDFSFADIFESKVDEDPHRVQIVYVEENRPFTLLQLEKLANKFAHWALNAGLRAENLDAVAVMMSNRPEYVAVWLGMVKIGVATALINTNSVGSTLGRSISVGLASNVGPRFVICDESYSSALESTEAVRILRENGIKVLSFEDLLSEPNGAVYASSDVRLPREVRKANKESNTMLYIFTSGTTGLPKASKISHSRFTVAAQPFRFLCPLYCTDVVYSPLPLYHSAAGILGIGACIVTGARFVTRKKFSVSSFSADCVKYSVTVVQYIGELCRYLTMAPSNPTDSLVKLRAAFGNGLRSDIWPLFQKRYNVEHIVEFYGATEGNIALFNATDHVGALGWVPRWFDFLYPVIICRTCQGESDDGGAALYRDPLTGLCQIAEPGEVGLVMGAVDAARSDRRFEGYTDKAATEKKLIKGVFASNDLYFNTGDLMSRDSAGYFYWADRTGDTYRWKGENVSTAEVESVLNSLTFIKDCTVFGIAIPGSDGRAGMAVVCLHDEEEENRLKKQNGKSAGADGGRAASKSNNKPNLLPSSPQPTPHASSATLFNLAAAAAASSRSSVKASGHVDVSRWKELRAACEGNLQPAAIPRFLRVVESIPVTSTFKHMKASLLKDGFDPEVCGEGKVWVWTGSDYTVVDRQVAAAILEGRLVLR